MPRITVTFKGQPVREVVLDGERWTIGRDPGCDVQVDSLAFEPRHASITRVGDAFFLQPLVPQAEIFIREAPVTQHRLEDGEILRIGKHHLAFRRENTGTRQPPAEHALNDIAGLQVLSGPYVGRIIHLDEPVNHIGTPGENQARLSRGPTGYVLERLEGERVTINGVAIEPQPCRLGNGDRIGIGDTEYHFFVTDESHVTGMQRRPQRHFTRIAYDAPATLSDSETVWSTQMIDLSLKGALVSRPGLWPDEPPERLQLRTRLDNGVEIRMGVRIAHTHAGEIGLECTEIGIDSVTELRRLIEMNLADEQLLQRELSALG